MVRQVPASEAVLVNLLVARGFHPLPSLNFRQGCDCVTYVWQDASQ